MYAPLIQPSRLAIGVIVYVWVWVIMHLFVLGCAVLGSADNVYMRVWVIVYVLVYGVCAVLVGVCERGCWW